VAAAAAPVVAKRQGGVARSRDITLWRRDLRPPRGAPTNTRHTPHNSERHEERNASVDLHPVVEAAAQGRLPDWGVAGADRRAHMARVAELLGSWAGALGLDTRDVLRWRAAGHLHDALRDAEPEALRSRVPPAFHDLPDGLLHGPAAAERLRIDGVDDGKLLTAVCFHTVGSPRFGPLGRALYAADFLEPGRPYRPDWRAELRGRMPGELDDVVFEIHRSRVRHRLEREGPLLSWTVDFWNRLVGERT
jgi:HD superfamily phosphohydrolase YqeK